MDYGYNPYQPAYGQQYGTYAMRQQMMQPPTNNLIRVKGDAGADAFQVGPNSQVVMFDEDSDVFFLKVTDSGGFPTKRKFAFMELYPESQQGAGAGQPDGKYVGHDELDELKRDIGSLSEKVGMIADALGGVSGAK